MVAERNRLARQRRATWLLLAVPALSLVILATLRPHPSRSSTAAGTDFKNFETLQVHPLAITPDGSRLLALNTPDARLQIFGIGAGTLDGGPDDAVAPEADTLGSSSTCPSGIVGWASGIGMSR